MVVLIKFFRAFQVWFMLPVFPDSACRVVTSGIECNKSDVSVLDRVGNIYTYVQIASKRPSA